MGWDGMGWDGSPGGPRYRAPTVLIKILPYIFVGIRERPSQGNISESAFEMLRCHLGLSSLIGCNISAPKSSL